jgi:hypothetical protein
MFLILFGIMLIMLFIVPLNATTLSINLQAGDQASHILDLKIDDRIRIQFNVVGTDDSYIDFFLVYPNGTKNNFEKVGIFNISFICDIKGEYELLFVNNDIDDSMLVTLNYEVEHYMFGMPQTFFLVLLIAVVSVAMVAVFVLVSPRP